ncbi:SixA phosphatase family protein [Brachymonas denitrificans]|jgi:phosphohistidine phosphatase|uniref:Phosphohistidine phosphatase, SixA n=1 Tax=Brachymonas denitrificans DSM 15123 TaxID=1121117 RepID=A0A1H8GWJ4_9BURK|nr:histidine phosphatase family protein [Brachymonas denitrificans]SEN48084.1 phosphohistidine phosphatase, SixA [Brachymonas denitrificans DSM 15123]
MDLILWRHAIAVDADEGLDDLKRPLTEEGEDQAKEMAGWLKRHLPRNTRILTSPALRTRQTVLRLTKTDYRVVNELAPNATPDTLLRVVNWPLSEEPVLVVGHQPTLGEVAQKLLGMQMGCSIKKGAVWWLHHRVRDGKGQVILKAVQNPRML